MRRVSRSFVSKGRESDQEPRDEREEVAAIPLAGAVAVVPRERVED